MSPARRAARALPRALPLVLALAAAAGCGGSSVASVASGETGSGPRATVLVLAVPARPDSAVSLTRRALGEARGTVPSLQWNPTEAILATRLTKNRRGPGSGEIMIAAIVARAATPGPVPGDSLRGATTRVQLQAWAMDSIPQRVGQLEGPRMSTETLLQRPRPVSQSDSVEWAPVKRVLDALSLDGARLISWNGPGAPKRP